MPKRLRAFFAAALFAFGASVIMWAGSYSPSFRDCNLGGETGTTHDRPSGFDQAVAGPIGGLGQRVWLFTRCEAVFLNENNGAVTALATLAVAIFTYIL